jgi:hypothetical protein
MLVARHPYIRVSQARASTRSTPLPDHLSDSEEQDNPPRIGAWSSFPDATSIHRSPPERPALRQARAFETLAFSRLGRQRRRDSRNPDTSRVAFVRDAIRLLGVLLTAAWSGRPVRPLTAALSPDRPRHRGSCSRTWRGLKQKRGYPPTAARPVPVVRETSGGQGAASRRPRAMSARCLRRRGSAWRVGFRGARNLRNLAGSCSLARRRALRASGEVRARRSLR